MGRITHLGHRRGVLTILASALVIAGLVLAVTAPAGPSHSAKVDAYGAPTPKKPTNPQNKAACDKYYGPINQFSEARGCRAIAARNGALKKCASKSGAKKRTCKTAARTKYAKAKARLARQYKAEQACSDKHRNAIEPLDPGSPGYGDQVDALNRQLEECNKKALKTK